MSDYEQMPHITKSQLIRDLQHIGLEASDTVMLHTSIRAIGWIVGGPRTVLEALFDILTIDGTLMMLAGWEGNPYELDEWTEGQQTLWLEECPPFNPKTSPADHREMSILAEYLRTWPNAERSNHPLASFVAVGRHAKWLTETHALSYGLGLESPLARLCEVSGRVLLLGAPFTNITLLHHAEHLVDLPDKRIDRYKMPVLRNGRKVWVDIEEFDTTNGIADFGVEDYFNEIGQSYVATNDNRSAKVGATQAYLLNANAIKDYALTWMTTNYHGVNT